MTISVHLSLAFVFGTKGMNIIMTRVRVVAGTMAQNGRKSSIKYFKKMTDTQFQNLSAGLRQVAANIPLSWGKVQNDRYDDDLKGVCNIFEVMSLPELEGYICQFDEAHKLY